MAFLIYTLVLIPLKHFKPSFAVLKKVLTCCDYILLSHTSLVRQSLSRIVCSLSTIVRFDSSLVFLSFTSNCHCFISCTPRSVIFSLQQTQSPYEPSTVQGFPTAFKPTYLLFSTINHSRHSFTFPHHLLTPSRIVFFILQKYSEFLTFSTPLPTTTTDQLHSLPFFTTS